MIADSDYYTNKLYTFRRGLEKLGGGRSQFSYPRVKFFSKTLATALFVNKISTTRRGHKSSTVVSHRQHCFQGNGITQILYSVIAMVRVSTWQVQESLGSLFASVTQALCELPDQSLTNENPSNHSHRERPSAT